MLGKLAGLARLLGTLLALVAGIVAIPNLDVALVLVILGIIGGIALADEALTGLVLIVLVLPISGAALGRIPSIGDELNAIANNVALAYAGTAATVVTIIIVKYLKGDLAGLTAKS